MMIIILFASQNFNCPQNVLPLIKRIVVKLNNIWGKVINKRKPFSRAIEKTGNLCAKLEGWDSFWGSLRSKSSLEIFLTPRHIQFQRRASSFLWARLTNYHLIFPNRVLMLIVKKYAIYKPFINSNHRFTLCNSLVFCLAEEVNKKLTLQFKERT